MPDLSEVAAELYAVAPEEFVAARAELVKRARAEGDKPLATAVSKLPKPTIAAWLLNALVRERPGQVQELISLGDALREAQQNLSGPQLRQLSRQRHEVLAAFTSMALAPLAQEGRATSADLTTQVQETLAAAIADPEAGQALLSGTLTKGLSYVGLGEPVPTEAITRPAPRAGAGRAGTGKAEAERERQRRLDAARAEVRRLEERARAADAERDAAQGDADEARASAATISARVDELRSALSEAQQALTAAEADREAALVRAGTAQDAADAAAEALGRARDALGDLEG